jgi:glycerol-3-phosphate dehydrogenase
MDLFTVPQKWDLIVVGGGIIGAGVLLEAARMNLAACMLEKRDFGWGTSSRTSKLIHGGLRYLKQGQLGLTLTSVRERERLLRDAPGLVEPQDFLMPIFDDHGPGKWLLEAGLTLYDLMAGGRHHQFLSREEGLIREPDVRSDHLRGCFLFQDAQVDDSRLVWRLIQEAMSMGATALNYTGVSEVLRGSDGRVRGVAAQDTETGQVRELEAPVVINATGAWAESLHPSPQSKRHLRPLRGSHLFFPQNRLPVRHAVSGIHPEDGRPIFVRPWESVVVVGTTDVDHEENLDKEPWISAREAAYLMDGVRFLFPSISIRTADAVASMAGLRPVFGTGKVDPSKESRDHAVWEDKGLVTVTGGKMTIFRKTAVEALQAARPYLRSTAKVREDDAVFFPSRPSTGRRYALDPDRMRRLYARYGREGAELIAAEDAWQRDPIPGTPYLWAELGFAARFEDIRHLDDLLLRRTRVGLMAPGGGLEHLDRIEWLLGPKMAWDRARWQVEKTRYLDLWNRCYAPPAAADGAWAPARTIPLPPPSLIPERILVPDEEEPNAPAPSKPAAMEPAPASEIRH